MKTHTNAGPGRTGAESKAETKSGADTVFLELTLTIFRGWFSFAVASLTLDGYCLVCRQLQGPIEEENRQKDEAVDAGQDGQHIPRYLL